MSDGYGQKIPEAIIEQDGLWTRTGGVNVFVGLGRDLCDTVPHFLLFVRLLDFAFLAERCGLTVTLLKPSSESPQLQCASALAYTCH